MSDPGLIAAKLKNVEIALRNYVNGISVNYLGMNIKVGDHISDAQISEATVIVVNTVDDTEDEWAKAHPPATPPKTA